MDCSVCTGLPWLLSCRFATGICASDDLPSTMPISPPSTPVPPSVSSDLLLAKAPTSSRSLLPSSLSTLPILSRWRLSK
eukprot:Awhi_evm3s9813